MLAPTRSGILAAAQILHVPEVPSVESPASMARSPGRNPFTNESTKRLASC